MSSVSYRLLLVLLLALLLACSTSAQPAPGTPSGLSKPNCTPKCKHSPPCNVDKNGGSLCVIPDGVCDACLPAVAEKQAKLCTDETESRVICDDVSKVFPMVEGQTLFNIHHKAVKDSDGKGYSAVVTAMHNKMQINQWSICYKRKGRSSDKCACKCQFVLSVRPSDFRNCRCVKGV